MWVGHVFLIPPSLIPSPGQPPPPPPVPPTISAWCWRTLRTAVVVAPFLHSAAAAEGQRRADRPLKQSGGAVAKWRRRRRYRSYGGGRRRVFRVEHLSGGSGVRCWTARVDRSYRRLVRAAAAEVRRRPRPLGRGTALTARCCCRMLFSVADPVGVAAPSSPSWLLCLAGSVSYFVASAAATRIGGWGGGAREVTANADAQHQIM